MGRTVISGALLALTTLFAGTADDVLKKADAAYTAHNYKAALQNYNQALKRPAHKAQFDRVRRRVGQCLAHLKSFGKARTALAGAVASATNSREKARALVEAGVLAMTMPQYYYEKDGVKYWDRWVQGATYHHMGYDFVKAGVAELQQARAIYDAGFDQALAGEAGAKAAYAREHLRCHLELASATEVVRITFEDQVKGDLGPEGYDALKTWNGRMAWAYDRAMEVQERLGKPQARVMAGYLKAMAFRRLMESYRLAELLDGSIRCLPYSGEAMFVMPDGWNPLKILESIWPVAQKGKLGDQVLWALATIQRQLKLYVDSVATCERLMDTYPKSGLGDDARVAVEQMTFPRLRLDVGRAVPVGREPAATLTTRNVKGVSVRVFRFPLAEVLGRDSVIDDPEISFQTAQQLVAALRLPLGADAEVARVEHLTKDADRHQRHQEEIRLPVTERGCYLVEATAGDLVYRDLLVVSDLGIVRQVDGDRTLVFAVDTKTGSPLAGVRVLVRQRYYVKGITGARWVVKQEWGVTDESGVVEVKHAAPSRRDGRYVSVYATDGERDALVTSDWYRLRRRGVARPMAYVFTDRPVYRPGHAVNFAALVRSKVEGAYKSVADTHLSVRVQDPKGTVIFDQAITTDDTGALDVALELGQEPPLGVYRINLRRGRVSVGSGNFRVEEYKKPEFEVLVNGPDDQVRLGGGCSATIQGRYYFGAPVAGAKVAYRVFRERYWCKFRRDEPYRDLYGDIPRNVDPSDRGRGRELVAEGQGQLDEAGRLVIEWSTRRYATMRSDQDSLFVVQADVTDASRRTISGAGRIAVTRTSFLVQMASQRGFWSQGEAATFEVQAQTPAGRPLATVGKARVYRVTQEMRDGKAHRVLTQILEEDASTNDRGIGFFRWVADEPGRFVISYQARDAWGELARGDIPVWVHGAGFTADGFEMKNLEILTDKRVYEPGETALVMVNSNYSDSAVLLCLEAEDRTLHQQVLRLHGKTAVLRLPIEATYVPNVHLTAYAVRDGGFFTAVHELLVPPTGKLLDVSMTYDKPVYKPGEKGEVTISVKDSDGQPVPAHVALTCLDSSLFYIQQDQTSDIRRFFYGFRRNRRSVARGSLTFAFNGYAARDVTWGKYAPSGWRPAWGNRPGRVSKILGAMAFGEDELLAFEKGVNARDGEVSEEFSGADGAIGLGIRAGSIAAPGSPMGRSGRMMKNGEADKEASFATQLGDDRVGAGDAARDVGTDAAVRSDFRDTAVWAPNVICGADGIGKITIPFPESLTTWRAKAVAWTGDTRVGTAVADVVTTKDVIVRLQAPRFFVEGDRLVVSAIVNNRTDAPLSCATKIVAEGGTLRLTGDADRAVELPPNGEVRVDWWFDVIGHGDASISVSALTRRDSDAMRMSFPVQPWGALKTVTQTSVISDGGQASFELDVPNRRRQDASELVVTLQPSLALTLMDALPYLIRYPYGCTEQTMSRFIPAVAVAQTLKRAGTTLGQIAEARKNLPNAAKQGVWDAVISDAMLDDVVRSGLRRITGMQNSDGGWGWWRNDRSSPYLTAYVITGLLTARDAGYEFSESIVARGTSFLASQVKRIKQIQTGAYVGYALAKAGKSDGELLARVYRARDDLGIFGKALLASAYKSAGDAGRAATIVQNLDDFVSEDQQWGTAHWNADGPGWRWWSSPIEANAAVLNALLDVDPEHRYAAPLAKWLVRNRQGNRWSNTRDTAQAILALVRYARQAGELDPDYEVDVVCGGQTRTFTVNKKNMMAFDNRFVLKGDAVTTGQMPLHIRMRGKGRVYVTSSLTYFTQEDKITGAGHELFVNRTYHKVEELPHKKIEAGREVTRLVDRFTRLDEGTSVNAGEIIEVRLEIEAKNDYTYLLFEDMKPAGFEPLQLRSGASYDRGICSNVEFRDEKTAFFVTALQQGKHTLSYRMRAEVPGTLRALPARGEAMYAPSFKGISDSFKITVKEMERL